MPRYITSTDKDLIDEVKDLETRISKLERNPRLSATAIDRGSLIVNIEGVIRVNGTVNERLEIAYFTSLGSAAVRSVPDAATSSSDIDIQVTDTTFDGIAQTFFNYYSLSRSVPAIWGGIFQLMQTFASMSWVENGVQTSFFAFRKFSLFGLTGNIFIQGRWMNIQQLSIKDGLLQGSLNVSAGVSSATVTYAQSYATLMYAIPTLHSASGAVDWAVTAQSTSSFTTSWIGTTAKIVNFWNIRM